MKRENIKTILSFWGIEYVEKIEKNKETVFKIISKDESYILKNKDIDNVKFEYDMLSHLKSEEIPVSVPLLTKDNELYVRYEDKDYVLYDYIEGKSIEYNYDINNKDIIFKYGEVLGSLHKGLRTFITRDYFENK